MPVLDRQNPLMPGGNPEIFRPLFIRLLRVSGNIREAAELSGLSSSLVRAAMRQDPNFAQVVKTTLDDATEDLVDQLERECIRRALAGSDLLMMFKLKQLKPEYRDKVLPNQMTQVNVKAYIGFTPDQWDEKPKDQPQLVDSSASLIDGTTSESDLSVSASAMADTPSS